MGITTVAEAFAVMIPAGGCSKNADSCLHPSGNPGLCQSLSFDVYSRVQHIS